MRYVVENGGLQRMAGGGDAAVADGSGRGGRAEDEQLMVHPWWCVARQALANADAGEGAVPLLDRISDREEAGRGGGLRHVKTEVGPAYGLVSVITGMRGESFDGADLEVAFSM